MKSALRILIAGLCGGLALNLAILLTFRLVGFGWEGGGVLLNPAVQSRKLIDVWTVIDPIPLAVRWPPTTIAAGLMLFALAHAAVYHWLARHWPRGIAPRTLRLALLIFVLSYVFWEFFTPFNMFGEPLRLIGLELSFWVLVALAEAFAIAAVAEFLAPHKSRQQS